MPHIPALKEQTQEKIAKTYQQALGPEKAGKAIAGALNEDLKTFSQTAENFFTEQTNGILSRLGDEATLFKRIYETFHLENATDKPLTPSLPGREAPVAPGKITPS